LGLIVLMNGIIIALGFASCN